MAGRRRRVAALGVVLVLAAVACGGAAAADPERFCEIDAEIDELGDPLDLPPDEARQLVGEGERLIDEWSRVAPDEIRPSAEIAADSFAQIIDVFEAAEFDATQIDDAELDAAFEAAFSGEGGTASDIVDEWSQANCPT